MTAHHTAHLDEVYPMLPFEPVSGHGPYLVDSSGREVLDFYGGHAVAVLGYGHPAMTEAIVSQMKRLVFQSNVVPLTVRNAAADALAAFAPAGLERVFFVNSGAEANENALRLALRLTGRQKILAIEHGFHGRSAAAAAVTWGAAKSWYGFPRSPMDVAFVPRDDIAALEAAFDQETAGLIIEPVQGVAGAYDFRPEFIQAARALCDRHGALLIMDEVQTGMGRLGTPFGAQLFNVCPDLLTTAKGLAGGLPAGAVIMTAAVAAELGPGQLGTTFGGAPVACAAISAVIKTIEAEGLLENVQARSAEIRRHCLGGAITACQGQGFLLGLRSEQPAAALRTALLAQDILTGTSADPHILRLLPPLTLEHAHVERLATTLERLHSQGATS